MERRIAIFGDIHANLDAFEAVLADCRAEGVTDFLCVGDTVGYNAEPAACIRLVRDLGCAVVKGNHDHYVSSRQPLSDFHPIAAYAIEWTRRQVGVQDIYWLRGLPFTDVRQGLTIVHATMDFPEEFGYVFDTYQAETNFSAQKTPLCFHGHTHCPAVFEKQLSGVRRLLAQDMTLGLGRKYFINGGSVGQPRDGDPRSSYAIWEPLSRRLRFRRVEYDVAAAQARIRAAALPERLAQRLEVGL